MTLAIAYPASGADLGPGYYFEVTWTSGAAPAGAAIHYSVQDPAASSFSKVLIAGVLPCGGLTNLSFQIGEDSTTAPTHGPGTKADSAVPCSIAISLLSSTSGTIEALTTFTGFTWDPYGGLGALIVRQAFSPFSSLSQILAAVQKEFPTTT